MTIISTFFFLLSVLLCFGFVGLGILVWVGWLVGGFGLVGLCGECVCNVDESVFVQSGTDVKNVGFSPFFFFFF